MAASFVLSDLLGHSRRDIYPLQADSTYQDMTPSMSSSFAIKAVRSDLGSSGTVVSFTPEQTFAIQVIATVCASISVTASVTALYWFCLMRRNYRRDLVLLLILSDLVKNFTYVMFAGVNFNAGPVQSSDAFCQASGYVLQTGLEACDCAIFFICLHMFLQIFPKPNTIFGYDGLYNVRYYVYALWIILPSLSSSLAFIKGRMAYGVQGTWCWLPVRPFWYRLALTWVPRYVIAILIMAMAIAIYIHVGAEFKLFGKERGRSPSSDTTPGSAGERDSIVAGQSTQLGGHGSGPLSSVSTAGAHVNSESERGSDAFARNIFVSPAIGTASRESRRYSMTSWLSPFDESANMEAGKRESYSQFASRRGSRQVAFSGQDSVYEATEPLSPMQQPRASFQRPSVLSFSSFSAPSGGMSGDGGTTPSPPGQPEEVRQDTETLGQAAGNAMKVRNNAIRRQVRGLFAYPIAYIIFWIMPFVLHCMNYSDTYAAHPVFGVAFTAAFTATSLGFVDVVIFCWRERPWRHIPRSDGSFMGSFCWWRFKSVRSRYRRSSAAGGTGALNEKQGGAANVPAEVVGFFRKLSFWRRLSSDATYTSGSDRKVRENEGAQARLDMERQEAEEKATIARAQRKSRSSTGPPASAGQNGHSVSRPTSVEIPGRRNWFDSDFHDDTDGGEAAVER